MYGLFLYRASKPEFSGTYRECKQAIDLLSDAERLHGWTIQPVSDETHRKHRPLTLQESLWALAGLSIFAFLGVCAVMALRGHIR